MLLLTAMAAFAVSDAAAKHLALAFSLARFRCVALLAIVLPISMHSPALLEKRAARAAVGAWHRYDHSHSFLRERLALDVQAEATAMVLASPLFVLVMARVVPKKRTGFRRAAPVLVGFAGALIVTRPTNLRFKGAELLPFASSMAWARLVVLMRKLRETDHVLMTLPHSVVIGV